MLLSALAKMPFVVRSDSPTSFGEQANGRTSFRVHYGWVNVVAAFRSSVSLSGRKLSLRRSRATTHAEFYWPPRSA